MLQKRVVGLLGIRRGAVCASVYDGKAAVRPRPRPGRGEQIVELVENVPGGSGVGSYRSDWVLSCHASTLSLRGRLNIRRRWRGLSQEGVHRW